MNKPTAILVTAGFLLGLLGAGSAQAASSANRRHHTRHHHRRSTAQGQMSMSHRRTMGMTMATPRRITNGHGPTHRRRGHGVYGGVFSEPAITNNGQADTTDGPAR